MSARSLGSATHLDVGGRRIRLTNLDKVLWPATGTTKGDLVDHYVRVAPALLPHLAGHPLTLHRFPDGVAGPHWYETRAPAHPAWVRTQHMHTFRAATDVHAAVVDDLPSLVWAANTAAIELHPYLGTADHLDRPTAVVFDLDPGPPATLLDAARVALALRDLLDGLGLTGLPKTSGATGLHVHVPLDAAHTAPTPHTPHTFGQTKAFARAVARRLTAEDPDRVVDAMARDRRRGKVFVDWSQNDPGRSLVAPYSLRGLWYPTAALPVTWDEVEGAVAAGALGDLVFLAGDVEERLERHGDLLAPALTLHQTLPW